jgi:hypothetical protein
MVWKLWRAGENGVGHALRCHGGASVPASLERPSPVAGGASVPASRAGLVDAALPVRHAAFPLAAQGPHDNQSPRRVYEQVPGQ